MRPWNDREALKAIETWYNIEEGALSTSGIHAVHVAIDRGGRCVHCGSDLETDAHTVWGLCLYGPTQYHSDALDALWNAYQRYDIGYHHLVIWNRYMTDASLLVGVELPW